MALLDKDNLAARMERARKHRVHHVGTKLNEAELREFEALAEKRQQTPSELIRGLVLREIGQDKEGLEPSAELIQIEAVRLLLINLFRAQLVEGKLLPEKTWTSYQEETKKRKREAAVMVLRDLEKSKAKP